MDRETVWQGWVNEGLTVGRKAPEAARSDSVEIREAGDAPARLFTRWAMALALEHHEPKQPLIRTTGGIAKAAPCRVTEEQEAVLTRLRDMTRGYARGY